MVRRRSINLFIATLSVLNTGCFNKDLDDASLPPWKPRAAFPAVEAAFSARDILNFKGTEGRLRVDENGVLEALYEHRVLTKRGTEVFKIPEVSVDFFNVKDAVSIPLKWANGDVIKRIDLKEGVLNYQLDWNDPQNADITLTLPQVVKDSIPYSEVIHATSDITTYVGTLDLSGYSIFFPEKSAENPLEILVSVEDAQQKLDVEIDHLKAELRNLIFSKIEGYLRSFSVEPKRDSVNFGVTDKWVRGTVTFVRPKIQFLFESDFGFPIKASFSNFDAGNGSVRTSLTGAVINTGYITSLGEALNDTLNLNTENTNLGDFFSIGPRIMNYTINLSAEVDADFSKFLVLTDTSKITVDAHVVIPLQLSIHDGIVRDTIAIAVDTVKELNSASLVLNFENTFPHAIGAQVYLADSASVIQDSLFLYDENIIEAGVVGNDGHVIAPAYKRTVVSLESSKAFVLYNSRKLIIEARMHTSTNENFVSYTEDNFLRMNIAGQVTLNGNQ